MSAYQRLLLRALASDTLRPVLEPLLERHVWRVEQGQGAGLKLHLPQNRDYVMGASELPVQRAIAGHLRPGGVFYDVGANVGFFSLLAARRVGATGRVCAFEPVPANAQSVRANAELNGLGNLRVFEVAAGRENKLADFLLTRWDGGGSLSEQAVMPAHVMSRTQVRVAPLDALIEAEALPLPDFVKIDVEGTEMDVLAGMSGTIRRCMPILLYEVDDGDQTSFQRRWAELDAYVAGFGYVIQRLENSYANERWQVGHSLALPEASI
jgi:FkbM family methyltransferase